MVPKLRLIRALTTKRFNSSFSVVSYDHKYTTVKLKDGNSVQFSNIFLRDSCQSPQSVDHHSSQKLFTTGEISRGIRVKSKPEIVTQTNGEEALKVVWDQETELESVYPSSFLKHYASRESRLKGRFFGYDRVIWNRLSEDKVASLNVDYEAYMNDKSVFYQTVRQLNEYGIVFVNDIPDPSSTVSDTMTETNALEWPVAKIAEKYGYIKKTFYGTLFDVKNVKEAKNIAYTNVFLPLHMDLLYYESPPGLQLLHAIHNSTLGGENIFVDSFSAVKTIRETDPSAFFALTQIPITYQYDNNDEFYYYQRPLVVEDEIIDKRSNYPFIKEVNYSPPFQGPFELGITKAISSSMSENANHFLFQDFIRGLQLFEDLIHDPENQFQIKLPEGTCVIFDNRRVLHSRNEFSDANDGDRWLMGTYVDGDSYRSKLRVGYKNGF